MDYVTRHTDQVKSINRVELDGEGFITDDTSIHIKPGVYLNRDDVVAAIKENHGTASLTAKLISELEA